MQTYELLSAMPNPPARLHLWLDVVNTQFASITLLNKTSNGEFKGCHMTLDADRLRSLAGELIKMADALDERGEVAQ